MKKKCYEDGLLDIKELNQSIYTVLTSILSWREEEEIGEIRKDKQAPAKPLSQIGPGINISCCIYTVPGICNTTPASNRRGPSSLLESYKASCLWHSWRSVLESVRWLLSNCWRRDIALAGRWSDVWRLYLTADDLQTSCPNWLIRY